MLPDDALRELPRLRLRPVSRLVETAEPKAAVVFSESHLRCGEMVGYGQNLDQSSGARGVLRHCASEQMRMLRQGEVWMLSPGSAVTLAPKRAAQGLSSAPSTRQN